MSDPGVLLIAEIHGLVGRGEELRGLLDELAEGSSGEADCLGFRVLRAEEPGEWVLLASWASEGALRSHYATTHYRRYRDNVGGLIARPSDVVVHHLGATIHALDPNPPEPGKLG